MPPSTSGGSISRVQVIVLALVAPGLRVEIGDADRAARLRSHDDGELGGANGVGSREGNGRLHRDQKNGQRVPHGRIIRPPGSTGRQREFATGLARPEPALANALAPSDRASKDASEQRY